VITDPTAMNLYFVNLEGVRVLGINDETLIPEVHIELVREVVGCPTCGVVAVVNSRSAVRLIDLSMAGRKIALVWNKRRFVCRGARVRQGDLDRGRSPDRCATFGPDPTAREGGRPTRSVGGARPSATWPRNSGATGTPSTTRSSPTAKR
jgi:hypothetical protein